MTKSEIVAIDGTKIRYEWKHHKKRNAIEIVVETGGRQSHVLINAELKEITFMGEIDWSVGKMDITKNGFRFRRMRTEEEFAREVAKKL